jgi:hypothetical protein
MSLRFLRPDHGDGASVTADVAASRDIATIRALSPEAMRAALVYVSGYEPDAFAAAMRHLDQFPASRGFLSEATS